MTDREILRTCEGCESPHLRLVADRLRERVQEMRVINKLAHAIWASSFADHIMDNAKKIIQLSEGK